MKGYKIVPIGQGLIAANKTKAEESLIHQLRKVKTMGDQGFVTKGLMYSDRKDGVLPEFDIRTDKWEVAQKASSVASKSEIAKRGGQGDPGKEGTEGAPEGSAEGVTA